MQLLLTRNCCRESQHVCDVMGSMARSHPRGQRAAARPDCRAALDCTAAVSAGLLRPPAPFRSLSVPIRLHAPCLPETCADAAGAPWLAPQSNSEQGKRHLGGGISWLLHSLALYIGFNVMLNKISKSLHFLISSLKIVYIRNPRYPRNAAPSFGAPLYYNEYQ